MNIGQQWVKRACHIYEMHGQVLPSLWAQGATRTAMAIPDSDADISIGAQVALLSIMAQAVEALAVGTVHEAWTKVFDDAEDVAQLQVGDLHKMSEVDPTVRTAMVSTWGDLTSGKVCNEMAVVGLDDFGAIVWDWSQSEEPEGDLARIVRATILAEGFAVDEPVKVLPSFADSLGWTVTSWGG